jgi:hypothetical protein
MRVKEIRVGEEKKKWGEQDKNERKEKEMKVKERKEK